MNDGLPEKDDGGEWLGPYRIVRELGRGAFGVVYEAEKGPLRKRRALKVLLPKQAENPIVVRRFEREALAASELDDDHIVRIEDLGLIDGLHFIEMEFLEGETLKDALRRQLRFSASEALDVMLPVIGAMGGAHERGLVHRDLKLENIFLARVKGGAIVPKVLDFGVVHLCDDGEEMTTTQSLIGTPSYMSPELIQTPKDIDARSDQWTLAVILYELLTGRGPFRVQGNSAHTFVQILMHPPPPMSSGDVAVDGALEAVLLRALSKDRSARFPSTRAFGKALLPFASHDARSAFDRRSPASREERTTPVAAPRPSLEPTAPPELDGQVTAPRPLPPPEPSVERRPGTVRLEDAPPTPLGFIPPTRATAEPHDLSTGAGISREVSVERGRGRWRHVLAVLFAAAVVVAAIVSLAFGRRRQPPLVTRFEPVPSATPPAIAAAPIEQRLAAPPHVSGASVSAPAPSPAVPRPLSSPRGERVGASLGSPPSPPRERTPAAHLPPTPTVQRTRVVFGRGGALGVARTPGGGP